MFQFRVADLTNQPRLLDLVDDPVYQHYVMLEYQAQRTMTETARQEATAAQKEAIIAKAEAARLAAKLRALGIDPE